MNEFSKYKEDTQKKIIDLKKETEEYINYIDVQSKQNDNIQKNNSMLAESIRESEVIYI